VHRVASRSRARRRYVQDMYASAPRPRAVGARIHHL